MECAVVAGDVNRLLGRETFLDQQFHFVQADSEDSCRRSRLSAKRQPPAHLRHNN
jgi:hypothetical protein